MSKYTRNQALEIVSTVIGLEHGENTYDVVHMNGSMAVVHHHNHAPSEYSHLRGVVIDLDEQVMITKSVLGSITPVSIRDFRLTEGTLNKILCGVEGTNLKIMKYKGTVYYVTNRRIYTAADKEHAVYVRYTMDILEKNPSKLFPENSDSAPYYHEFILVNRHTSQLTTIHIPEAGFLVYVGTRTIDFFKYNPETDTPIISATEFKKGTDEPISTRYIYSNRDKYRPVSTIYPSELLTNDMDELCKYIQYSREFCIVTYTDDNGDIHTVRVCHDEYLHRENLLQFCNDLLKRFIALCRNIPMDNTRNRNYSVKKYLSRHKLYAFEDAEAVLNMMQKKKRIPYLDCRNRFEHCRDNMNTDSFIINTWIDMYNALPDRNKHQVYDLYSKYTKIVDTLYELMVQLIDDETPDCPASVLELLKVKLDSMKHYAPKESAFSCTAEYRDHLISSIRRNIIQYTKINDFHDMAAALDLV